MKHICRLCGQPSKEVGIIYKVAIFGLKRVRACKSCRRRIMLYRINALRRSWQSFIVLNTEPARLLKEDSYAD